MYLFSYKYLFYFLILLILLPTKQKAFTTENEWKKRGGERVQKSTEKKKQYPKNY